MAKRAAQKTSKTPVKPAAGTKPAARKASAKKPAVAQSGKRPASVKKHPAPVVLDTEIITLPDVVVDGTQTKRAAVKPERHEKTRDPREFAIAAARLCRDDHCEDVVVMDVRALSSVSDYIIVATGTSDRQMYSVLRHTEDLGRSVGSSVFKTSSDDRSTWLIADFVDVVVHLFEPNTRSHYDLEMLWGDAPRVQWEREDQRDRDRAGIATKQSSV